MIFGRHLRTTTIHTADADWLQRGAHNCNTISRSSYFVMQMDTRCSITELSFLCFCNPLSARSYTLLNFILLTITEYTPPQMTWISHKQQILNILLYSKVKLSFIARPLLIIRTIFRNGTLSEAAENSTIIYENRWTKLFIGMLQKFLTSSIITVINPAHTFIPNLAYNCLQ